MLTAMAINELFKFFKCSVSKYVQTFSYICGSNYPSSYGEYRRRNRYAMDQYNWIGFLGQINFLQLEKFL